MKSQSTDLSYYRLRLQELLNTSFPELADDTEFVIQRSNLAAEAYSNAFMAGNTVDESNRIADEALFQNLYFSKFDTVFQVVCYEFDKVMADEELRPFAIQMLPICEPVFIRYKLSDDFAYTNEYDVLYTELTGTIAIWIENNGLQ